MPVAAGLVLIVFGAPVALAALYLCALAVAAQAFKAAPEGRPRAPVRLLVLVPAHNEAPLIERCIASIAQQDYPSDRLEVWVVADNCTDETAAKAAAAGVGVLERHDLAHRGKGHALGWALERLLSSSAADAVVVVDADSRCERGMLRSLAATMGRGADAIQADYLPFDPAVARRWRPDDAAILLFNRCRPRGRSVLGLSTPLLGNGMLLRRRLLEAVPWSAFSGIEDLEYSVKVRGAGGRVEFAASARLYGEAPQDAAARRRQRSRWEGGRLALARRLGVSTLIAAARERRLDLVDAALDVLVPPLSLLALITLAGVVLAVIVIASAGVPAWAGTTWLLAAVALTAHVGLGLPASDAPRAAYGALARAPLYLVAKAAFYVRGLRTFDPAAWEPTRGSREAVGE